MSRKKTKEGARKGCKHERRNGRRKKPRNEGEEDGLREKKNGQPEKKKEFQAV